MAHRGPDGKGSYCWEDTVLLHARLAIIDPQGGRQPMQLTWAGESYVIVYNGELYNTGEIRSDLIKEGHSFESHSDTEVLLHAYAQWGEGCLERLNGIFAFAVWEERKKRLFLARDRIGVKPLFYKAHEGGLIFASEIKTILAYPTVRAELDGEGALQLIMLGAAVLETVLLIWLFWRFLRVMRSLDRLNDGDGHTVYDSLTPKMMREEKEKYLHQPKKVFLWFCISAGFEVLRALPMFSFTITSIALVRLIINLVFLWVFAEYLSARRKSVEYH